MADKDLKVKIRPFDPKKDKPIDIGNGQYMTEKNRTVQDSKGRWTVVPSIWFDESGGHRNLESASDDILWDLAQRYESSSGKRFPRFSSVKEADKWAMDRSKHGGATRSLLTDYGASGGSNE